MGTEGLMNPKKGKKIAAVQRWTTAKRQYSTTRLTAAEVEVTPVEGHKGKGPIPQL